MRNRTHSGLLLLMLASVLVGCDDGRRSGPNGPSTTAQQTYTLFGAVSEMTADGSSPIEGATATASTASPDCLERPARS
jgi:hypothetical protein